LWQNLVIIRILREFDFDIFRFRFFFHFNNKNTSPPPNLLEIKFKKHIFFNKSCSNVISEGVFFYQKSKSRHYSVVFRTLKLYFSQKNRCPNLAHPPLTYLRLNSKSTFFDHLFSTEVVQMLHLMVFFFIINQNPLTVLSSLED